VVKEEVYGGKIFCSTVYTKFFELRLQDFKNIFFDNYKRTLREVLNFVSPCILFH